MPVIPASSLSQGYQRESFRLMHQGRTHGVAAAKSGYTFAGALHATLADVAAFECSTGDLPGYARRTFTPTYADDGTTATIAVPSQIDITTVTTGQGTSTGIWFYVDGANDSARYILSFWPANGGAPITLTNHTYRVEPVVFAQAP